MATNRLSKGGPGGGYGSRVVTERPVRTGSGSKGVSPGWVGQRGQLQGDHLTNRDSSGYRGEGKFTGKNFQPVPFGNQVALNVKGGGPGAGRTIYQTGTQGMQGRPAQGNPPAQGKDILNQFGPNKRSY